MQQSAGAADRSIATLGDLLGRLVIASTVNAARLSLKNPLVDEVSWGYPPQLRQRDLDGLRDSDWRNRHKVIGDIVAGAAVAEIERVVAEITDAGQSPIAEVPGEIALQMRRRRRGHEPADAQKYGSASWAVAESLATADPSTALAHASASLQSDALRGAAADEVLSGAIPAQDELLALLKAADLETGNAEVVSDLLAAVGWRA